MQNSLCKQEIKCDFHAEYSILLEMLNWTVINIKQNIFTYFHSSNSFILILYNILVWTQIRYYNVIMSDKLKGVVPTWHHSRQGGSYWHLHRWILKQFLLRHWHRSIWLYECPIQSHRLATAVIIISFLATSPFTERI